MIFIERMAVLGRGLIFQPVLASLPYTQTCTYNSDNIITLQNILTLQIPIKINLKKTYRKSHDTSECFDVALTLSTLDVKK